MSYSLPCPTTGLSCCVFGSRIVSSYVLSFDGHFHHSKQPGQEDSSAIGMESLLKEGTAEDTDTCVQKSH